MHFGPIPIDEAYGAILAHKLRLADVTLRKGHELTAEDLDRLRAAGIIEVIAAKLGPDDLQEDDAAQRLATAVAGANVRADEPATGRCNLFADQGGIFLVDRTLVDKINRVDPAITFATLPEHAAVEAGRMVATVKIIPFAAPRSKVFDALHRIGERGQPIEVLPFRPMKVGVISTLLPSLKMSTIDKTLKVLSDRLAPACAPITADVRVDHTTEALAASITDMMAGGVADLIIVFGASAIVDRQDVIPAALERAGGEVIHFGMPVDPGNLLLVGNIRGTPVLGAPGCARSPKENGFDWVLTRILAGLNITADDIVRMGVGGLLMDIVSRPQPRSAAPPRPFKTDQAKVSAVVLAAGRARRMGGPNKLLAEFDGVQQIRRIVMAALDSNASDVTVVTGHQEKEIVAALEGLDVRFINNRDYVDGLSTSVRAGIENVDVASDAALMILSDMPALTSNHLNEMIAAYDPDNGAHIVLATTGGKRGNPVLWSRRFFGELTALTGDTGARHVIAGYPESVVEVDLGAAAALDIDTPEALRAAGGVLPPHRPNDAD